MDKMKLFEPTLFIRDGKEWIKGFTMERPISSAYGQFENVGHYNRLFKEFEASVIEYPVCEVDKEEFCEWAYELWNGSGMPDSEPLKDRSVFRKYKILEKGVRIDVIADRLEMVDVESGRVCKNCSGNRCFKCETSGYETKPIYEKQIRLLPEVKEESQNELWDYLIGIMDAKVNLRILRSLKKQFTIKRNQ